MTLLFMVLSQGIQKKIKLLLVFLMYDLPSKHTLLLNKIKILKINSKAVKERTY